MQYVTGTSGKEQVKRTNRTLERGLGNDSSITHASVIKTKILLLIITNILLYHTLPNSSCLIFNK